MKTSKKRKVYFDLLGYRQSSAAANISDFTFNFGTYCINEDELESIDAKSICNYLLEHKDEYFMDCNDPIIEDNLNWIIKGCFIRVELYAFFVYIAVTNIRII